MDSAIKCLHNFKVVKLICAHPVSYSRKDLPLTVSMACSGTALASQKYLNKKHQLNMGSDIKCLHNFEVVKVICAHPVSYSP
jgi:hypothetical protein